MFKIFNLLFLFFCLLKADISLTMEEDTLGPVVPVGCAAPTGQLSQTPSLPSDAGEGSQPPHCSQDSVLSDSSASGGSAAPNGDSFESDHLVIKNLFTKLERSEDQGARSTLECLVSQQNCLALLALALLYKTGNDRMEKNEDEAERIVSAYRDTFIKTYTKNLDVFTYWQTKLEAYGFAI